MISKGVQQILRETAQDTRHALRLWASRPWHTGFAILALAIGIGANVGVFSVVNGLLLRSLPFHDAASLAYLHWFPVPADSAKQFHEWRGGSSYLTDAAVFEERDANLGGGGAWRRVQVAQASSNFFTMMGTQPILGRGFAPGDDADGTGWGTPGRNAVVIIGYGLWQELFAGDPKALGATILLDGNPMTVIGIAPPGFDYPGKVAMWKPAAFSPGNKGWETVGRIKPGVSWAQARQAFDAEVERLSPNIPRMMRIRYPSTMTSLRDELAGPARKGSLMLLACVVLILLIACTNVANLLMARTADRAAELSIRSALGASRARLAQQLMTECLLLSLVSSVAGVLVAAATATVAAKFQPAPLSSQAYALLDGQVLFFALAAAALSGLLFGLMPSVYATRLHSFSLRGSGKTHGVRFAREALVASQVMLTIVLLAGSISVGRAFIRLMHADRGFDCAGLVTVSVSLMGTTHTGEGRGLAYFEDLLERIRRLPGVRSASATEFLPLDAKGFSGGPLALDGRRASENSMAVPILADYFRTMGGRLIAGREFTEADIRTGAEVAVVNEHFAGEFGAPADAIGHNVTIGRNWKRNIVGVVKGIDYMADGANSNQVYLPSRSPGGFLGSTLVIRVAGRAEDRLAQFRQTIQSVDPRVPIFGVKTMQQRLDDALARPQFYRTALLCFAAFALLLAVIGIYGVVSYSVAQRTHEMGVRMALGATPAGLRIDFIRQGLVTIAAGAVPGVVAAVLTGRFLESLIEGARPANAATYAGALIAIAAVAAAGIWIATRPVARLDIVETLRAE